ncbi:LacI family DNA-binding transcriptional regulator [Mesoaciditoga lauensis]|uniref:LacI family DNA-binding transcriptional regulator n=1 Tax=Mesoaciditoga lauensis TaxID=1495039 RepID=UPI00055B98CB|nr:LacI family DNA-binding transcriptional regulator [Mesoaciditoga lauensis]
MVRIKDIAKSLNVSTTAVSKALNHKPGISQELRARILKKAEEMGYIVNSLARGMATSRTFTVGVIVSDIMNPFSSELISAAEVVFYARKYNLVICNTGENPQKEREYLELLASRRVDGILTSHGTEGQNLSIYKSLIRHGMKVVFFDRVVENINADSVSVDNIDAIYKAVKYLVKLGHKKIGAIYGILSSYPGSQRLEGFKNAIFDAGIILRKEWIKPGYFKEKESYEQTIKILRKKEHPTAIIAMNNLMTLGVVKAIKDLNMNIPNDISVIGFDDADWMSIFTPTITTIAQPSKAIGMTAATLLLDAIENSMNHQPQNIILKAKFIERESCLNIRLYS